MWCWEAGQLEQVTAEYIDKVLANAHSTS